MSGSYIFLLHLLGFSLVSAAVITGTLLNRKLTKEKDYSLKLYLGGLMRSISMAAPVTALILLVSGIGNIYNRNLGAPIAWYEESWLVVKIILFAIMLVNGTIFGPSLAKKRMQVIKALSETAAPEDAEQQLAFLNKQLNWFFLVQNILLIGITFFSAFGTSKHPGVF